MDIESEHLEKNNNRVNKTKKRFVGDSISVKKQVIQKVQLSELYEITNKSLQNNTQTLLLGDGRTDFFVTEDSRTYITNTQQYKKDHSYNYVDPRGYFDSVHNRYVKTYSASELQQKKLVAEFRNAKDIALSFRQALKLDLSPIRMWQVSLAGAVLFGMISMNMIYKNLGQNAMAKGIDGLISSDDKVAELIVEEKPVEELKKEVENKKQEEKKIEEKTEEKEKVEDKKEMSEVEVKVEEEKQIKSVDSAQEKKIESTDVDEKIEEKTVKKTQTSMDGIIKKENVDKKENADDEDENVVEEEYSLAYAAYEMVDGYPIEKMLPYILKQDPEVAKYMIAMAKQESAWGKRVPVLNGQDCYNYWGFRSKRKLMGSGGHTCFNSRQDAVETVGKRIHELIYEYDRKTADRLIVWKCGSSCAGHSQDGVDRWIGTVGSYYDKLSE